MHSMLDKAENFNDSNRFRWVCVCILIAVAGGLYLNTLDNDFTNWDDGMIYSNYLVRDLNWESLKKIFSFERGGTYQPIRVLSYAIDYCFWKLNPFGYHITNILFYVLTCLMVFFTLRTLSRHLRDGAGETSHLRTALFGSLIFAAHPVHVEAVAWLAARKEVLQGFFLFTAFYLYLLSREKEGREKILFSLIVLASTLMAILSKPSAVVFPAVLLVYEVALRQSTWTDFVKNHRWFFFLAILVSFFFAGLSVKVMLDAGGIKAYHGGTLFNNLLVSFYIFLYNIKLLFLTINYSAAYTLLIPDPIFGTKTILIIGITFLLFGTTLWSLKRTKVIFFSFFFFFVTLLPYLNLLPISTLLADRYVFIASFSYCFLLGIGFDKLYSTVYPRFSDAFFKLLSVAIFLFLLGCYSFMTIQQNRVWENSYTLWSDAVEKYPESNTANALMGVVYMELGMDEKAAEYLEKAVQILPIDYESRNNLGIVYGRLDKPEKALNELTTAIFLKPDNDNIKINLSVFYQRQKEYKKAAGVLKYLLSKNPQNANLYYRLGVIYKDAGDYGAAISEILKSMELAPNIINPYEELGNIYASRFEDLEKAKYYYTKGTEAVPNAKFRVEDLRWMIQDLEAHK